MENELSKAFERREYIHMDNLPLLPNYIYINSGYSPNRGYYWQQYNYVSKLAIVCFWKEKHGLPAVSCKGEAICNDELVNFLKDKQHKYCVCSTV